jgi:hypothetical protein
MPYPLDPRRVAGGHARRGHRAQPLPVAAPAAEAPRAPINPLQHGGAYP